MAVSPHTDEVLHGHGHTPAAWSAVVIAFLGFLVGGVGFPLDSLPIVIVGAVLIVASPIVGKVMQVMGFGQPTRPTAEAAAPKSPVTEQGPAQQTA